MRITKFGHACVRIEHEGHVVVLDPGVFTEPDAVDGATAVLVTHVHPDHLHPDNLRATDAPVFTVGQVAEQLATDAPDVAERTTTVPGESRSSSKPALAHCSCCSSKASTSSTLSERVTGASSNCVATRPDSALSFS
jgi:L-ascorbate metabolism protein UlaG (beta-lactamase superfamily)